MEEDIFQTNLNTIKEFILDENKLVTYVSLSKDLCIHVNDSKKLLSKFVENIIKNNPDINLNVSYILSGLSEDNKARTTVATATDLEDIKKTLKMVFFEHIYSVSKGLPFVDQVSLLALNNFEDLSLCMGQIKSHSCIKHTFNEMQNFKSKSLTVEVKPNPSNQMQKKIKEETKDAAAKDVNSKTVTKVHETKSEPSVKSELVSPKKDSLNNVKPKRENNKNGITKTQKGIAGFFNKSSSVPSNIHSEDPIKVKRELGVNITKDNNNDYPTLKIEKMDVEEENKSKFIEAEPKKENIGNKNKDNKNKLPEIKAKKMDVEEEIKITKSESKKKAVNGKVKNESLNKIKKTAKVDKKRKRVLHVSDSESEEDKDPFKDDIEDIESEDEIPPTPNTNTIKITSGIINPKKKRKIIDKTYTDEEGYILTKKVEVYESCSDEELCTKENLQASTMNLVKEVKQETSPKGKKIAAKATKKKVSPPQKGKQATLMNFFKKV